MSANFFIDEGEESVPVNKHDRRIVTDRSPKIMQHQLIQLSFIG